MYWRTASITNFEKAYSVSSVNPLRSDCLTLPVFSSGIDIVVPSNNRIFNIKVGLRLHIAQGRTVTRSYIKWPFRSILHDQVSTHNNRSGSQNWKNKKSVRIKRGMQQRVHAVGATKRACKSENLLNIFPQSTPAYGKKRTLWAQCGCISWNKQNNLNKM